MRRVVVTGLGLLTPLGQGVQHCWDQLVASKSGLKKIERFDVSDLSCKVAGIIPEGDSPGCMNAYLYIPAKDRKKMDNFITYGMIAACEAIEDSGWKPTTEEDRDATGVMIGSGIGGLSLIEQNSILLHEQGPRKISPFFIPACLINLISGHVSIKYGFTGPNHSVVTACATGAHAIGDAARLIAHGDCNVMVAGGSENAICRIGLAGFASARALSTGFNDRPTEASRPWDRDRDGFVMGEGAGIVVLEEYEHAKRRGAKIYAELVGYGISGDANHITAPHPEGRGGFMAMKKSLQSSGLNIDQIDYINAHGTSTPLGDEIELNVVKRLFGDNIKKMSMSSTKSSTGHLLGAAGGVEAIFSILAMRDGIVPPTINLHNPPENCGVDLVPHTAKNKKIDAVLSNSFGFGGTNACLIFKKV